MKQVKCKSGLTGWEATVQENWGNFECFEHYCEMYGLLKRIGFGGVPAKLVWDMNPLVQGSVDPSDLCISPKWNM